MTTPLTASFLDHFADLPDPRTGPNCRLAPFPSSMMILKRSRTEAPKISAPAGTLQSRHLRYQARRSAMFGWPQHQL